MDGSRRDIASNTGEVASNASKAIHPLQGEGTETASQDVKKRPQRETRMSEKGKAYEKETMEARSKRLVSRVEKQLQLVECMYEGADRDMVKSEILNLDKAFTELTEVTNRLMKVTDNEEDKK